MPYAIRQNLWIQLDGCPAYYGVQVRQWLDETYLQQWIGRRGTVLWPAKSPDITPLDFYLSGTLKGKVYRTRVNTRHELIERINIAFTEMKENRHKIYTVINSTFQQCQSCIENNGGHFEMEQ